MQSIPETGFVRLSQIIGDKKASPPIAGVIPIGKSSWWEGVKSGLGFWTVRKVATKFTKHGHLVGMATHSYRLG